MYVDVPSIENSAQETIETMVGPAAKLREDQLQAIVAVCSGNDALVVQATGWGKSAIFWAATKILRDSGAGPTIIISPLLALMRNQVEAAQNAGLQAATINSSNRDDWQIVHQQILAGKLDVLLVAPERLGAEGFVSQMKDIWPTVGLLVVDEAHCVSDWGFDFRPDYQRVAAFAMNLTAQAPTLAVTATANRRVTDDVAKQMGVDTVVLRGPLARPSLTLEVVNGLGPIEQYVWLVENVKNCDGSGIVYAQTVADVNRATELLQRFGYSAAAYSGAVDAEARAQVEEDFIANKYKVVVATSALGMGYDKSDIGFVIHLGSPSSPVAYYQQVGRAGRAIDQARAILLPSENDDRLWVYFAESNIPKREDVEAVLVALETEHSALELTELTGIRKTKIESLLKNLAVDGVVQHKDRQWSKTGIDWIFDDARYEKLRAHRRNEADIMRSYASGEQCLMLLLQRSLDDPAAEKCQRCSVCQQKTVEPVSDVVATQVLEWARSRDIVLPPRKRWPRGVDEVKGAMLQADEGRVLAFGDDPAWQDVVELFNRNTTRAPDWLLTGALKVLERWQESWQRPQTVTYFSWGREAFTCDLAEQIAQRSNFNFSETLTTEGTISPDERLSATPLVRTIAERVSVDAAPQSGNVLLVVDQSRGGYDIAYAAQLLKKSGFVHVLPFVVHRLP